MENREEDILDRGNILVHDYNGDIVRLKDAKIWHTLDGDYVEPREYISDLSDCDNIIRNILKLFCIL